MYYEILPLDYKETFSRYTGFLHFIGVEFFDPDVSKFAKIRMLVFNIIFLPFLYSQLTLVANFTPENFLEGAQAVPITLMSVLNVIKMTTAVIKKSEIKDMFLEIGELWPQGLEDHDEKAVVMKNWMRRMGTLLNIYYIYTMINLTIFEVMPVLITCYNFYCGVDEYVFPFVVAFLEVNSVVSYVVIYLWEVAATILCHLCLYLPFDMLMMTLTSNVSILFRLLQIEMESSVRAPDEGNTMNLSISDPESCERIVRIVKTHQKLLRIADQLSDIFGLVIFVHVMFSAVVVCCFGFLTVVFGGIAETIINLLTVWNSTIGIFLLALCGQLLCDTSSSVADAAYRTSWYESDLKVKKLVLFIIIRSQRTSYLSALGFSNMTLRSFSKIMSTSWTYFSLLVQMYKEN